MNRRVFCRRRRDPSWGSLGWCRKPGAQAEAGDAAPTDECRAGDAAAPKRSAKPAAAAPNLGRYRQAVAVPRQPQGREDDAIKVNLKTAPGVTLSQETVRDDVRAIWKTGFFEDVQVEVSEGKGGSVVAPSCCARSPPSPRSTWPATTSCRSRRSTKRSTSRRTRSSTLAKIKKNVEKIKDAYVEKGFYMAEVSYEIKLGDSSATVDVWFHVRENAKVEVRRVNFVGNKAITDGELRGVISTQEGNILSVLTSAGTYREDRVFQRDLLLIQAHYWDHGYVQVKVGNPLVELSPRQAVDVHHDLHRRRPPVPPWARST